MKKFLRFLSSGILFSLFAIAFFNACEIGLGEAVDTDAPNLTIDYPPESSIIREQFVLAGTCTDDMGVTSVKVKLTNTDTGTVYGPFDANIDKNSWSITLNTEGEYNGFLYPDGRYTSDAYAVDGVGRESGVSSRSFDIDNTAPVLYLSKPLSVGSDTEISTFGKQVKISGDICEDHTTEYLNLRFQENKNGNFGTVSEIKVENVTEMSTDSPLLLARYYTESEAAGDSTKQSLRSNYLKIYGTDADTKKDDKTVYCTIELSDNARIYQTPGDSGTGTGNISKRYFINSRGFANSIVSDSTFGLTIDNMKKYINGTLKLSSEQRNSIESTLEQNTDFYVASSEISTKSSKFKISPDNNPTYSIENLKIPSDGNTFYNNLNSGSSFTIDFKAGNDSIYIKPSTITVSIESKEKDAEGKPVESRVYVDSNPSSEIHWTENDDLILRKTITVAKTDGFSVGKQYVIKVSGTDRDGNELLADDDNGYGFTLQSSSIPPTVKVDEDVKEKYYKADYLKTNKIEIPVTIETDGIKLIDADFGQTIDNAIWIMKDSALNGQAINDRSSLDNDKKVVTKNNASVGTAVLNFVRPSEITQPDPENHPNKYEMIIKVGGDDDSVKFGSATGIFKYNFYVTVIDSGNKAGTDLVTFYVDNEPPVISGETISINKDSVKTLSKENDATYKWVNGIVYVKAKVKDNYKIKNTTYKVYAADDKDGTNKVPVEELGEEEGFKDAEDITIKIDTTDSNFKDPKKYKTIFIELETEDAVGNKKTYPIGFENVYVDQTTDIPKFEASNFAFGKAKSDVNSSVNMFDKSSKLIGKIEDDDGLSEDTKLYIFKYEELPAGATEPPIPENAQSKTITANGETFNVNLSDLKIENADFYTVAIVAKDSALGTSAKKFTVIAVDNEAPVLKETTVATEDVLYKKGDEVTFNLTVSDDSELPTASYLNLVVKKDGTKISKYSKEFEPAENKDDEENDDKKDATFEYKFNFTSTGENTVEDGKYEFEFTATDLSGKSSTVTRTICKDSQGPKFTESKIETAGKTIEGQTWYTVQTLQVKGSASDEETGGSGIKEVKYQVGGGKWLQLSGTTSFEGTLTNVKDGNTVNIKAIDNAGNETNLSPITVRIDNERPILTTLASTIDAVGVGKNPVWKPVEGILVLNGANDVSIKGTAEDLASTADIGISGLEKIEIMCGKADFTSPDCTVTTFSDITDPITNELKSEKEWIGTISTTQLESAFGESHSGQIYAKIYDKAGNSWETPLVSVKYDSQYPEAKITSIKYKDTETKIGKANGTITIHGTTKDDQSLKNVILQYAQTPEPAPDSEDWKQYGTEKTEDLYTWSFDVDTTDTTKFKNGKTYVFRVTAQDDAGNKGNSGGNITKNEDKYKTTSGYYETIEIDQDTDRPIITISNLAMNYNATTRAHMYGENTIHFSVTDDDGECTVEYKLGYGWKDSQANVIYYTKTAKPSANETLYIDSACVTPSELKVKKFTESTNSITTNKDEKYNSTDSDTTTWKTVTESVEINKDGPTAIIFRVTDAQRKVFTSGTELTPKIQDMDKNVPDATLKSLIYVDVDTTGPTEDEDKRTYSSYDTETKVYCTPNSDSSKVLFGGIHTKFEISLQVKDENGVSDVVLKHNGAEVGTTTKDTNHKLDGGNYTWTISEIDVSDKTNYPTGRAQFVLEMTDVAGNKQEKYINIDIDNTATEMGIDSHNPGEQLGTAFILKGYLTENDGGTTIKYYTDANPAIPNQHNWSSDEEIKFIGTTWRLNVDGRTAANDGETHTESHKKLFVNAYGESEKIVYNESEKLVVYADPAPSGKTPGEKYLDPKPLYFHFLVTDKAGNTFTKTFNLDIDPQGDIPTIQTTYPVGKENVVAGNELSGKVRIQGKADVKGDNKLVGIYMQIDPKVSTSDVKFDAVWTGTSLDSVKNSLKCPSTTEKDKWDVAWPSTDDYLKIEWIYDKYNNQPGLAADKKKIKNNSNDMYAIYVGDSLSWNYYVNENGEFGGKESNTIGIRMFVVDSAGNINILKTNNGDTENDVFITLDAQAPQIGTDVPLYLYQYAWVNNGVTRYTNTGNPTAETVLYKDPGCNTSEATTDKWTNAWKANFASMEYVDDMFIKGEWWLSGSVSDDSGIKSIEDTKNKKDEKNYDILNDTERASIVDHLNETNWHGRKGYVFNYRIGSNESNKAGTLEYQIYTVEGNGDRPASKDIKIKFDNKPPVISTNAEDNNFNKDVKNSYGFYTLGSAATEGADESGFARAVVYFKRTSSKKVFDNYLHREATGNALLYEKVGTNNAQVVVEDDLYWKVGTVAANGISGAVVTIAADDKNIHKGGLVKLGGGYYTIKDYNSQTKKVTLDANPSTTLAGANIYFAIGNVIDYVGSESSGTATQTDITKPGFGYYTDSIDNKDDYIIESVITTNHKSKWTASINSNNIPDGPVEIHYVVFDKAGNHVSGNAGEGITVKNNNPRLAALTVYCDYNNDNTYAPEESKTFYFEGKERYINGNTQEKATALTENLIVSGNKKGKTDSPAGTSFMTVKNKIKFVPEIVGGNGELKYVGNASNGSGKTMDKKEGSLGQGHIDGIDEVEDDAGYLKKPATDDAYISGHTTYKNNSGTDVEYNMLVGTDDLVKLGNSSDSAPTWFDYTISDSTDGGSLSASFSVALNIQYNDTTKPNVAVNRFTADSVYVADSVVKGHIELEDDLTTEVTNTEVTTATANEQALGSDPKVSGIIKISGTAYDDIRLSQLNVSFTGHSNIGNLQSAATYSDSGAWNVDTAADLTENGWTFAVNDRYNNENGHLVDWTCTIDTSFIENVAELDRVFTITAKDKRGTAGGLTSVTGNGQASANDNTYDGTKEADTLNRPTYKMDVVPYITKVTTNLSSTDPNNPTAYSRTALGHYPVSHTRAGFGTGTSWTKESVQIYGFNFAKDDGKDYKSYTPDNTAAYAITTNGISSLNNINKNTAEYNKQPNGTNNDKLTDDVIFDVWQFNSKAGVPRNGKADNLVMKINPSNGMLGFAFSDSSEYFSMPDSRSTSLRSYRTFAQSYDYLRWNALAFDEAGNSFACTVGGDINSTSAYADTFDLYVGRWGVGNLSQGYNKNGTGGLVLESIGQVGTKTNENDTTVYKNKNRFQSQSFATLRTKVNSSATNNATNLYMAYYDATNDEIRIKSGVYTDTTEKTNFGNFTQYFTYSNNDPVFGKWSENNGYSQIIIDGTNDSLTDTNGTPLKAGPYVSIGVTSDNRVVMVWYDNTDLWYTYTTKATAGEGGAVTYSIPTTAELASRTGVNHDYWAPATKIMTAAGKYCQLVVDNQDGVHVGAYDVLNSSLKYVYIPTANAPTTNRKSATVDSYLDVGENLTIDVAQVSKNEDGTTVNRQVPYFGYWGGFNEKPRYAYLEDTKSFYGSGTKDGVDSSDKYTGVWECTTVPVVSAPNKNTINVGVWKYNGTATDNGKLAYSTTGTNRGKSTGTNSYNSSNCEASKGTCYGNGTNNGVLAYTISISGSERWIETAQKK